MAPLLTLEPNESREAAAEFFIAERLRGIPLVSRKSDAESPATSKPVEQKQVAATAKSFSSEVDYGENDKSEPSKLNQKLSESLVRNQVGKRDAPGATDQNQLGQGGILFRQTGVTSAISNVVAARTTTTTTTRRPVKQQTRTTTRRPPVIATSTTRRAPIRQTTTRRAATTSSRRPKSQAVAARGTNGAPLARLVKQPGEQREMTTPTTSTKPVRMIEPISSLKMSSLEEAANSSPSLHSTLPSLIATTAASTTQQQQHQQQQQQLHRTTLTRVMQTLTTQPVNQRRNQQNVVQSRGGSNRSFHEQRNGFAGENWYLFNRPDGNFSVFEILVLISNVLIVCTIILVILFNWIKMFKKRARTSNGGGGAETQPKHQPQQLQQVAATNQVKVEPNSGDRASKMSFVSSQVSQATSSALDAMTTTTTSASMMTTGAQKRPLDAAASGVRQQMAPVGEAAELAGRELVSDVQKVANEFQQAAANVANKAMAIVQPSENNSGASSQLLDSSLDKLKRDLKNELTAGIGGRSISRSVSDLSPIGNAAASPKSKKGDDETATQRADAGSTPDRVEALEKLFRNPTQRSKQGESKLKSETEHVRLLHSSSSLESIELPDQLVESIKRTATGPLRAQVDESLGPSPNLLLGEAVAQTQQQDTMKSATNGGGQLAKSDQTQSLTDAVQIQSPAVERPQNPHMLEAGDDLEGKMSDSMKESAATTLNKERRQPMATIKEEAQKRDKAEANNQDGAQLAGKVNEQNASKTGASQKPSAAAAAPRGENDSKQQKQTTADVKNHQVVVNRLDKRKTNLEIVDLRDASVTGKMRASEAAEVAKTPEGMQSAWISMDGVAVVQPSSIPTGSPNPLAGGGGLQTPTGQQVGAIDQQQTQMSPSEIIESRFHVDYKSKRRQQKAANETETGDSQRQGFKNSESMDSKQEEYVFNNIENELELDNKMRNRKYFVYVVHDGHFTAKKECIARIELPPKRRITLAELRQLIANSQDISLTSLRRNRFKFVTETYRLLNENEDAAVLHQVYPTQGVFLKLNVAEQENQVYPFKGGRNTRSSSGGGGAGASASAPSASSLSNTTIASRSRANARPGVARNNRSDGSTLPAIEVNSYAGAQGNRGARASSVGRARQSTTGLGGAGAYKRSKSSVQMGRSNRNSAGAGLRRGLSGGNLNDDTLPSIGTSESSSGHAQANRRQAAPISARHAPSLGKSRDAAASGSKLTIGEAASDLGANMISGARKLFTTTFGL